jgi:hypothetical protein
VRVWSPTRQKKKWRLAECTEYDLVPTGYQTWDSGSKSGHLCWGFLKYDIPYLSAYRLSSCTSETCSVRENYVLFHKNFHWVFLSIIIVISFQITSFFQLSQFQDSCISRSIYFYKSFLSLFICPSCNNVYITCSNVDEVCVVSTKHFHTVLT